jgi:CHAD domain-containing protein
MAEHREIELTWSPADDAAIPDLTALPGVARVGRARVDRLDAVYFDTADLALTRAGVSLRRRTGGNDEGWHLKVPAGDGRDEVQVPLSRARARPPAALRRAVWVWTRDAPLEPIATIATRRSRRPLITSDGTVLAELADDRVRGTCEGSGRPVSWREWELELAEGDRTLLEAADGLIARAGIEQSAVQRKIVRVLGDRLPPPTPPARVGRTREAGPLVHERLARQVEELKRRDSQIRRGLPAGVHRARIACRRLRSALATYRPLLDREVTDPIREEIKWFGRSLADARDAQVVHDRLRELLDAERRRVVVGPVRRRLDQLYDARSEAARAELEEVLCSDRYARLLDRLDALVAEPPWTEKAAQPAVAVLPKRVRRDWRRLKRRVRGVDDAPDRGAELHEVRKDAKRVRYAAETLEPAWGKDARRLVKAAKKLTSHLGELQDTAMSRSDLLELAREADEAGESSMTWGLLLGREEQRAADLDHGFPRAWKRASRKKLRRWLR